jgi:hypothetical protein
VASRTLDDTAFILLNSRIIRLNEVGTRVWELFENGSTLEAVVEAIAREYDITKKQAASDTRVFVGELLERELLVPDPAQSGRNRWVPQAH